MRTLLLVVTFVAACASEQPTVRRSTDAGMDAAGYLASPACADCIERECWRESSACTLDATCSALRACRGACATAECDQACVASVKPDGGATAYMASLARCAGARCSLECPVEPTPPGRVQACGASFDEHLGSLAGVCRPARDCACQHCANDWLTCLADPECSSRLDCDLRRCDGVCTPRCAVVPLSAPALRCFEDHCEPCHAGDAGG